jgi:hypothetical protein
VRSAIVSFLAAAALISGSCVPVSAADDPNTLVIVFKDGRQQTISMADVARIEFKTSDSVSSGRGSSFAGQGRFIGKWRVGNGAGGHFFITLDAGGTASKTLGASHGTWTVVGGEARISWDDGWHDAIRKAGDKYEKAAFEPGKSFTENPTNVADATNTTPQPN